MDTSRNELDLLINATAASNQTVSATEQLCQRRAAKSTKTSKLVSVVSLKKSIKDPKENVSFQKTSNEGLWDRHAEAVAESTRICASFVPVCVETPELQEKRAAKDVTIELAVHA